LPRKITEKMSDGNHRQLGLLCGEVYLENIKD
jgi:hypothetical protein